MEIASGKGSAFNATLSTNGPAKVPREDGRMAAALAKVEKLRAHLAGAEAELARLRAERDRKSVV